MVRRKLTLREIVLGTGFLLLLLAILTFYIWYQTEAVRLGFDLGATEKRAGELREDIKKLEARKAELLSLREVDRIARGPLGLGDPRPDQIVREERPPAPGGERP